MIVLAPNQPWPTKEFNATALEIPGVKQGVAVVPVPFPAVLNAGIAEWNTKTSVRPTHLLCGPDAKKRFEEFGHFQASLQKTTFTMEGAHSVNDLFIIWTETEGMMILGDCEE